MNTQNIYASMTESELNAIARELEEENEIQFLELAQRYNRQQLCTPEQEKQFLIIRKKIELLEAQRHLEKTLEIERSRTRARN